MRKYLLEGRLYNKDGHYYTIGLVLWASSFREAEEKGIVFSNTCKLCGLDKFLIERISTDDTLIPSGASALIYMIDELSYTDANGDFQQFLKEASQQRESK